MNQAPKTNGPQSVAKARLRLWLRLLKLSRHIEAELRENLRRDYSTTLPRFDVMAALNRFPDGLKMSQLSEVLMVSNGNVTGIVDRLVADGIIIRVPVPGDRRASRVQLTQKGMNEFTRQAISHEAWIDRVFAVFGADEAQEVCALLDKVERTLNDEEDGP